MAWSGDHLRRAADNVETHLRLASAYLNTQEYPKALDHAERAVALDPELGRAYETKGMALWRGGRSLDALAAFQQATRYDPANVEAHYWLGELYRSWQPPRERDAAAEYRKAIALAPESVSGRLAQEALQNLPGQHGTPTGATPAPRAAP